MGPKAPTIPAPSAGHSAPIPSRQGGRYALPHHSKLPAMAITLTTEMEQARVALAARPAAELADFILSLAFASDGISECVHAFALAADPKAAAGILGRELSFLREGEPSGDDQYHKGARHVARSDRFLDTIERCVLPRDPQTALHLLTAFVESTDQISDHCWDDDFGASQLFERAGKLAENAKKLPVAACS